MPAPGRSPVGTEALDDPHTDPALVRRMLGDISRANRWLGGRAVMYFGLARLLDGGNDGRALTLCDIGTGAGDLPRAAARWAARRGITLRCIGLERIPAAAGLARHGGMAVAVACAGALPLRAGGVDLVLISQLAHHLDRAAVVQLFRDASRAARRGVLVCDLRPSPLARYGFPVAGRLLGLHPVTIADGVTSVARGFSAPALAELAREAGCRAERCRRAAAGPRGTVVANRPVMDHGGPPDDPRRTRRGVAPGRRGGAAGRRSSRTIAGSPGAAASGGAGGTVEMAAWRPFGGCAGRCGGNRRWPSNPARVSSGTGTSPASRRAWMWSGASIEPLRDGVTSA